MPIKLPINSYDPEVTDRDALLAIHEELRSLRSVLAALAACGVPLMVLAFIKLLGA